MSHSKKECFHHRRRRNIVVAIALEFASRGARVAVADIDKSAPRKRRN